MLLVRLRKADQENISTKIAGLKWHVLVKTGTDIFLFSWQDVDFLNYTDSVNVERKSLNAAYLR